MDNILEVRGLSVCFKSGQRETFAVDDVSFDIRRGETLCVVGESGCGKSMTSLSILKLVPTPPGRYAAGEIYYNGRKYLQIQQAGDGRQDPRQGDRHDLPGADDGPQPHSQDRRADHRGHPHARQVHQQAGGLGGSRARPQGCGCAGSRALRRFLSPSALRRHAPAGDDRHGAFEQAQAAHCRRADHGAGRHHSGADTADHPPPQGRKPHDRPVHHPRSGRGRRDRRPRGGDVRGQDRRGRFLRRSAQTPMHPYTQGLLKCLPRVDDVRETLDTIEGQIPDGASLPQGCYFHPRCPLCTERCKRERPSLRQVGERKVACHLVGSEEVRA